MCLTINLSCIDDDAIFDIIIYSYNCTDVKPLNFYKYGNRFWL